MKLIISGPALQMLLNAVNRSKKTLNDFGVMSPENDHANQMLAFTIIAILKTSEIK